MGADRNNVFVIDSDGELYKCWDDIGHLELSVGNIKNGLTLNKTFVSYMSYCAFDDEDCRDCPVLPIVWVAVRTVEFLICRIGAASLRSTWKNF